MTTATDRTFEILEASVLDDDYFGYPDRLAFLPSDLDDWARSLWTHLTLERTAVVVVDATGRETLFTPVHCSRAAGWISRMRGRTRVRIQERYSLAHRPPGNEHELTLRRSKLGSLDARAPHVRPAPLGPSTASTTAER